MFGARMTAIGTYVPEKRLTNFELEQIVIRIMIGLFKEQELKSAELPALTNLQVIYVY